MRCCFSALSYSLPALLTPLSRFVSERLLGRLALFLIPVFKLVDRISLPTQEGVGIAVDSQRQFESTRWRVPEHELYDGEVTPGPRHMGTQRLPDAFRIGHAG